MLLTQVLLRSVRPHAHDMLRVLNVVPALFDMLRYLASDGEVIKEACTTLFFYLAFDTTATAAASVLSIVDCEELLRAAEASGHDGDHHAACVLWRTGQLLGEDPLLPEACAGLFCLMLRVV